jgi:hypothetical protein
VRPRAPLGLTLAASLCASLAASACFEYVPVAPAAIPAGQDVRVYLSRRGLADLPEDLPTGRSFVVGRWTKATADSVMLQVPVVSRLEDPNAPDIRQNLLVARGDVVDVRRRRFSPAHTVLAIGAAVGGGAVIVTVVLRAGGDQPTDAPEGPDQSRIP